MILASFVGIFAIPPLYVMFQALREKVRPSLRPKNELAPADSAAGAARVADCSASDTGGRPSPAGERSAR